MKQHPDRVRSVILKGVTPASDSLPRVIARDAQRSLDIVFDDCAKNEACRQAFPNLKREFADALARFDKGSVTVEIPDANKTGVTGKVELSRGAFGATLRSLLQSDGAIAQLPMMIHQAYGGDYAPFVNNTLSIRRGASKGLSYGMFLSVVNAEDLPLVDPKQVERESAGTFMGDYYYRQMAQAGELIPSGTAPPDYKEPARSAAPTLIISGHLDPATPPENGEKVAQYLPNSLRVVVRYGSHGYSSKLSPCVDQLMADFIARGAVKGLDASCIDRIPQTPFQIPSAQTGKDKAMTGGAEQELRKLENDWLSVYISGDKATYDRVVADDFTGTDESAVKRGKEQDRALLPAAPTPGGVALNEDVEVRLYGETAVVTGRIVTKFKARDQEILGFATRFTDTWLKRQGRWQVVARHYSRLPIVRKAIKLDAKIYDAYAGEYELAPGLSLGIFKEGESLFGQVTGQPKFELYPESEIVFFLKAPPALFLFIRNDKGQVAQMLSIQDGRVTTGKKIK
jgi:pimeloyl-ACP methyl ester carboxylesterase